MHRIYDVPHIQQLGENRMNKREEIWGENTAYTHQCCPCFTHRLCLSAERNLMCLWQRQWRGLGVKSSLSNSRQLGLIQTGSAVSYCWPHVSPCHLYIIQSVPQQAKISFPSRPLPRWCTWEVGWCERFATPRYFLPCCHISKTTFTSHAWVCVTLLGLANVSEVCEWQSFVLPRLTICVKTVPSHQLNWPWVNIGGSEVTTKRMTSGKCLLGGPETCKVFHIFKSWCQFCQRCC